MPRKTYDTATEQRIADTMRRLGSGCTQDQIKAECGLDDEDIATYGDKACKRAMRESVTALKLRREPPPPVPGRPSSSHLAA